MDRIVKRKPEWVWARNSKKWILSQKISTYGDHELDYACEHKTLNVINMEPSALFIYNKEPIYKTISKWRSMKDWNVWVFREYNISCGTRAVIGHKDLKKIDKVDNALFIFDKEEIV